MTSSRQQLHGGQPLIDHVTDSSSIWCRHGCCEINHRSSAKGACTWPPTDSDILSTSSTSSPGSKKKNHGELHRLSSCWPSLGNFLPMFHSRLFHHSSCHRPSLGIVLSSIHLHWPSSFHLYMFGVVFFIARWEGQCSLALWMSPFPLVGRCLLSVEKTRIPDGVGAQFRHAASERPMCVAFGKHGFCSIS